MRRASWIGIIAGITLLVVAAPALAADTLKAVKKKGVMVAGVKDSTPPFGYVDEKTRTIMGYDVDIVAAIAKKLGVKLEVKPVTSASRMPQLVEGNIDIILCERGIRTFETETRNTLDINAIPVLKGLTHLPVVVDPSHATGRWDLVTPTALAGIAAGADGILVEVHTDPEKAMSDGNQSLKPKKFAEMMDRVRKVAEAVGRSA